MLGLSRPPIPMNIRESVRLRDILAEALECNVVAFAEWEFRWRADDGRANARWGVR